MEEEGRTSTSAPVVARGEEGARHHRVHLDPSLLRDFLAICTAAGDVASTVASLLKLRQQQRQQQRTAAVGVDARSSVRKSLRITAGRLERASHLLHNGEGLVLANSGEAVRAGEQMKALAELL